MNLCIYYVKWTGTNLLATYIIKHSLKEMSFQHGGGSILAGTRGITYVDTLQLVPVYQGSHMQL